jgi:hypothetical protein
LHDSRRRVCGGGSGGFDAPVRLVDTSWSGTLSGTTVASPAQVAGKINVLDVANVAVVLAGLDRPAPIWEWRPFPDSLWTSVRLCGE